MVDLAEGTWEKERERASVVSLRERGSASWTMIGDGWVRGGRVEGRNGILNGVSSRQFGSFAWAQRMLRLGGTVIVMTCDVRWGHS